jgi:hypothetical protein
MRPSTPAHFYKGYWKEIRASNLRYLPLPLFLILPPTPSLSALPLSRPPSHPFSVRAVNGLPRTGAALTYYLAEAQGRKYNELRRSTCTLSLQCACVTVRDRTYARIEVICT